MEHKRGNFHGGAAGGVKETAPTIKAPQVKHRQALEHIDGSGRQTSEHPAKNQSKIMRFLRQ